MKKFLSVLLVFVLLASLVSVAFAAVNGATCPENDGGEMYVDVETTEWEVVDTYPEYDDQNGIYYLVIIKERAHIERWFCTVNPSHNDVIRKYERITEKQLMGYGK